MNNSEIQLPKNGNGKNYDQNYGSHWIILLPKNFKGLLGVLGESINVEQNFLSDSPSESSFLKLFSGFEKLFTQGESLMRKTATSRRAYIILLLASPITKFY